MKKKTWIIIAIILILGTIVVGVVYANKELQRQAEQQKRFKEERSQQYQQRKIEIEETKNQRISLIIKRFFFLVISA